MKPSGTSLIPRCNTCVIDGGYLLHRVVWTGSETFLDVCIKYVQYVQLHFEDDFPVVFNGYDDEGNCTKKCERIRRSRLSHSVNIFFDENVRIVVKQSVFLENSGNKSRFIGLLHQKLENAGVRTILSPGDPDRNIAETAISIYSASMNSGRSVIIVGEDTDLVVLMVALTPRDEEIFFLKPSRGKKESLLYTSAELQGEE